MTDNDFHARRTELSNTFAAAGAELLDYMGCAGALAAIPNTQQYVVAGDIAAIRAQLDTVAPQRRMRHGERPELDLYFGPETGQPRRWAALITSAGHGMLQEYGTKFEFAQPGQEVLEVMEILPASPATASKAAEEGEQVAWMIEQESDGKRIYVSCNKAQAEDWLQYDLDRKIVPLVRQVANKAEVEVLHQVAAPEVVQSFALEDGRCVMGDPDLGELKDGTYWICKAPRYSRTHPATTGCADAPHSGANTAFMPTVLTDERISQILDLARLNTDSHCEALPSEPSKEYSDAYFFRQIQRWVAAQAGQVAVPGQAEIEWSHDVQERLIAAGGDESDEVRGLMAEAASLLAALTGRPAQASTAGERPEQQP